MHVPAVTMIVITASSPAPGTFVNVCGRPAFKGDIPLWRPDPGAPGAQEFLISQEHLSVISLSDPQLLQVQHRLGEVEADTNEDTGAGAQP